MAELFFVWFLVLVFAFIPGVAVGRFLGKQFDFPAGPGVCIAVAVLASFVTSIAAYRSEPFSIHYHAENLIMFLPPYTAALLMGWWIGRKGQSKS